MIFLLWEGNYLIIEHHCELEVCFMKYGITTGVAQLRGKTQLQSELCVQSELGNCLVEMFILFDDHWQPSLRSNNGHTRMRRTQNSANYRSSLTSVMVLFWACDVTAVLYSAKKAIQSQFSQGQTKFEIRLKWEEHDACLSDNTRC